MDEDIVSTSREILEKFIKRTVQINDLYEDIVQEGNIIPESERLAIMGLIIIAHSLQKCSA